MRVVYVGVFATLATACNGAPSAPVIGIGPETPRTADALVAVVLEEAIDVEDDPFTYAWRWTVDGIVQDDLVGPEVPADRTARGQLWEVAVTADDGEFVGEPGVAATTIANTAPTARVTLSPASPLTTDALLALTEASDPDDDLVSFRYAWTVDDLDAHWTEAELPAERTAAGQRWSVTVVPLDDADEGEPVSAQALVDNTAPALRSAVIHPAEPVEASVLSVELDAEDPDGDTLDVEVTWFVDEVEVSGSLDGSLDGARFDRGQRVYAEVVLSDGTAESAQVRTDPVVVRNTPPTVRVVRIEPATLFEDSVATVVGGSWADDDGDPEAYRVSWTVDDLVVGEGDSLDGAAFDKGEVVSCLAFPFDGTDEGEPVACNRVTVQNTAPSLDGVLLGPDPGRTADDLVATPGTAIDPDGDAVSVGYAWTVNGSAAGGSGATFSASLTEKGDLVEVTATPSDGSKTGAAVTASLTVANTAPEVTTAALSPSTLRTRDGVGVSYATEDVDGDSVTASVTWTVDGTTAGSGSSLGWTAYVRGETVTATIVPTDGTDSGSPFVVSTVVENTAPTAPVVAVSPAYPEEDDDLVCTIATAAKDDDGDSLTYTVSWTLDGSPFTTTDTTLHTGDTVDAADTEPGDVFACTAVADDGTDEGPSSAAATARVAGGVVAGFSGKTGPTFTGWTQCEGYLDTATAGEIPAAWGDDCTATGYSRLRLVCGESTSSYRYVDVSKNVFRDGLSGYPETGIVTDARDQGGTAFSVTNAVWAKYDDPHRGASWWAGSDGCGASYTNLTVNNRCTFEASNCFGQGLNSTSRYLWVYVGY